MKCFHVSLPNYAYPIYIDAGNLREASPLLADALLGQKAAVVSDETVWRLHGTLLASVLQQAGISYSPVIVKPGETSKSFETLLTLYHAFSQMGLRRDGLVLAFGGGVVGDLAGFAAATYMRGVPFIQIPTTLLAQVDSSVGGKVAVNLEEGKNLVGSFYQPRMVVADTQLLETLSPREFAAGMAEVIKYAAIGCQELLSLLEHAPVGQQNDRRLNTVVELCCRAKAEFVAQDERDAGIRQMLNFGHTFGHAIEKYYEYRRYSHGEAVAIGMVLAARTGVMLGKTHSDAPQRLEALLHAANLPFKLPISVDSLIPLMTGDKKNSGDRITLVLLRQLGELPATCSISPNDLWSLWQKETAAL